MTTDVSSDSIEAQLAAAAPAALDRMNTAFEDSMLFVGRVFGERPEATATRAVGIDVLGFDLIVTDPYGDHPVRVDFANRLTTLLQVSSESVGVVLRARELSGEPGETSAEREYKRMTAIRTFITEVAAVEQVNPHLRRITFRGGDLATFSPLGPDTFLYVLLPPLGRTELTIDQSFSWENWEKMPEDERPVGAYYTLRAWRPEVAELDMLFVLHGDTGPASAWAARATPGDPVALWGPREAYEPPAGTDWHLLVADDTGLPAVATILESLPAGSRAVVVAEVDNPAEDQPLRSGVGIDVHWQYRNGEAPGTTTTLIDAVRHLDWPEGTPYVWGGGESRAMTAVRKYVRHERGLTREQVSLTGYWRHASHATDPIDDE